MPVFRIVRHQRDQRLESFNQGFWKMAADFSLAAMCFLGYQIPVLNKVACHLIQDQGRPLRHVEARFFRHAKKCVG
jgi:hypothetical protein